MKRKSAPGVGPYSIVLVGLFILSALAVRTWQPVSHRSPVHTVRSSRFRLRADALDSPGTRVVSAPVEAPTAEPQITRELRLLDNYAMPQRPAESSPPVADRAVIAPTVVPVPVPAPPDPPIEAPLVAARNRRRAEPNRTGILPLLPRHEVAATTTENRNHQSWPRAESLIMQLESLRLEPECTEWADQVLAKLEELESTSSLGAAQAAQIFDELDALAARGGSLVGLERRDVHSSALRAQYALTRRLEIWRHVHTIVNQEPAWRVSLDVGDVKGVLSEVDAIVQPQTAGQGWRDYLLVDHVRLIGSVREVEPSARRALARRVLERLDAVYLSAEQQKFLEQGAFEKFAEHMRRWSYEPLDYRQLLERIEQLEQGMPEDETGLIEDWRTLRWSPWEQTNKLAEVIDLYYRNANVRVAVSAELINRMLPDVQDIEEHVDDQILGAQVSGRSRTMTRLFVELVPDRLRWRFGLVARGQVDSSTHAEKGAITFYNDGATFYRVRKLMTVDGRGVFFHRAEAVADNSSQLTDVETAFDGLPLVGPMVRSLARRGHKERAGEANAEVEWKVGARVAQRMDDEVAQRVAEAEQRYTEKILGPLRRLQLNPVALEMQTTDRRLIARYRVAADHQLAAYTPRPQAPGDSVLSVQIHETALNNFVDQLHLGGRRVNARQLVQELATAMGQKDFQPPEDLREDVVVQFADYQPVRIGFVDGQVTLTMNFAELKAGREQWYDFTVRTRFSPQETRDVQLVRDDTIELSGPNLGVFNGKAHLRLIFTAILNRYRTLSLMDKAITANPKMADVGLSQFVLRDGWLGVALSPMQVARRPAPSSASPTR